MAQFSRGEVFVRSVRLLKWRRSPQNLLFVIGLLMVLALLPTMSGCVRGPMSSINRVIQAVGDLQPFPDATQKEYERFTDIYRQYAEPGTQAEDQIKYFRFAFKRVRASYVNAIDDAKLIDAAIKGIKEKAVRDNLRKPAMLIEAALDSLTASLDPHSGFMNAREYGESFIQTKGEFGGLGIEVTMQDGLVKVVAPIEGTPASRAGMQSGDLIVAVDGEKIKGMTLAQAVRRMRGRPNEPIELLVRREGMEDFKIEIVRAIIKVRAVRWRSLNRVAYIRVSRFSERVETGIIKAFAAIRSELESNPDGVILDLRNNPGGLLDQSVILADAFLNSGEIVSVRGRTARNRRAFEAAEGDLAAGIPMIVLVNGGSASASEIVASALKNHRRATVMGEPTFGKGSVQTIIPMPVEGALRLTTALYYGADGHTIQARGVVPDIIVSPRKKPEAKGRREADLPGAIPAETDTAQRQATPRIFLEDCPASDAPRRAGREKSEDRLLGCALAFLKTGSQKKFLAAYGAQGAM